MTNALYKNFTVAFGAGLRELSLSAFGIRFLTVLLLGLGGFGTNLTLAQPKRSEYVRREYREPAILEQENDKVLRLAGVRATDFLLDLGCGNGELAIAAARTYKARGLGVDADPQRIALARGNARSARVEDRIGFIELEPSRIDLASATVIVLHENAIFPPDFYARLFALKSGTRVVAYSKLLGAWEPDIKLPTKRSGDGFDTERWLGLWVVPAKLAGSWSTQVPNESGWTSAVFRFEQRFQNAI